MKEGAEIAELEENLDIPQGSSYEAYPKYKQTGVYWFEEIPEHWEVKSLKFLGSIRYGVGEPPEYVDDGIPFIRATDVYRGKIDTRDVKKIKEKDIPRTGDPVLKEGEILVVRSGAYTGDSALIPEEVDGSVAGSDMIYRAEKAHPSFIAYTLLSGPILKGQIYLAKQRAAQEHLNAKELGDCQIPLPPLEEQKAIADFLDERTRKIDELIEAKQKLLDLLEEKRRALITRAVTQGLDADVAMMDSGVEWLGEVPEHWGTTKIKHLSKKIGSGKTPLGGAQVYVEEGVMFLRSQNIHDNGLRLDDVVFIDEKTNDSMKTSQVKENDVLLNITGASIGRCSLFNNVKGRANVNQHVCIIRPIQKKVRPEFLHLIFTSVIGKSQIFIAEQGSSREGVNFQQIRNMVTPIPDIKEQDEILAYLKERLKNIESIKGFTEKAMERLKEYRGALVSSMVKGLYKI